MAAFFELQVKSSKLAELFSAGFVQLGAIDIEQVFVYEGHQSRVDGFEFNAPATVSAGPPPSSKYSVAVWSFGAIPATSTFGFAWRSVADALGGVPKFA